jgi:hypothetical protein
VSSSSVTASSSSVSTDPQIVKHGVGASTQIIQIDSTIAPFYFNWLNATGITVSGVPTGISTVIDNTNQTISFSGAPTVTPGDYVYTLTTVGGTSVVTRTGTFTIIDSLASSSSTATSSSSAATVGVLPAQKPFVENQAIKIYNVFGTLVAIQPAGAAMPTLPQGLYIFRSQSTGLAVTRWVH